MNSVTTLLVHLLKMLLQGVYALHDMYNNNNPTAVLPCVDRMPERFCNSPHRCKKSIHCDIDSPPAGRLLNDQLLVQTHVPMHGAVPAHLNARSNLCQTAKFATYHSSFTAISSRTSSLRPGGWCTAPICLIHGHLLRRLMLCVLPA